MKLCARKLLRKEKVYSFIQRVDNSNSAQRAINQEVNKMAKSDVESKVYTEFNEQFQAIAWVILLLLLAEILILDRKNPLFKNIHLFSNKK